MGAPMNVPGSWPISASFGGHQPPFQAATPTTKPQEVVGALGLPTQGLRSLQAKAGFGGTVGGRLEPWGTR